ncbi:MAG: DsrE family protein [Bacteroidota bacterium]|jgi:intracellular sulfur oxidation DsrE/DsrF family protein|nr:DsrE family protein [Bacteroidota bacterium]
MRSFTRLVLSCCVVFFFFQIIATAQSADKKLNKKQARMQAKFQKLAIHPYIQNSLWTGVIPVKGITETIDVNMPYKLLFNVTIGPTDSATAKTENSGITEIGRVINLHVASGVPAKNIEVVVLVHGPALFSLLENSNYQKRYSTDNSNLPLIEELQQKGVKFIACGQALTMLNLSIDQLVPHVGLALSAQTMLSYYQLKGYVLYNEDKAD